MNLSVLEAEPPGVDVVEKLRQALAKAEAGELSSIAIAVVYRDGSTGSAWSNAPSLGLLLGATARLSYLLAKEIDA